MSHNGNMLNVWNLLRILLLAVILFHLLDSGVEARKNRRGRHKNRRLGDRRTANPEAEQSVKRGRRKERRARRKSGGMEDDSDNDGPRPTLVQLYRLQQRQDHKKKAEGLKTGSKYDPSAQYHVIKQFTDKLRQPQVESYQSNKEPAPVPPIVLAKVNFFIKRQKSLHFYHPTSTSSAVSPGLGVVSVHTARGKFGVHSTPETVFGRLIHIADAGRRNSHFGCANGIENWREIPQNNEPWIALIARGYCDFLLKIKLAEKYNATAAIIYDNKEGEMPGMFTLGTNIVSLAISKHDGHKVARLADSGTKVLVNITVNTAESEATTSAGLSILDKLNTIAAQSRDGDNGATLSSGMTSMISLLALLAMVFQYHVTF